MGARDLQVNGAVRPNQPDGCAGWLRWERLKNWGQGAHGPGAGPSSGHLWGQADRFHVEPAGLDSRPHVPAARSAGVQGPEDAALFHVELLHSLTGAPGRTSHSLAPTRPRRNGCTRAAIGPRKAFHVEHGAGRAWTVGEVGAPCTTSSAWLECYFPGAAAPMRPGLHTLPRGPSEALHV